MEGSFFFDFRSLSVFLSLVAPFLKVGDFRGGVYLSSIKREVPGTAQCLLYAGHNDPCSFFHHSVRGPFFAPRPFLTLYFDS